MTFDSTQLVPGAEDVNRALLDLLDKVNRRLDNLESITAKTVNATTVTTQDLSATNADIDNLTVDTINPTNQPGFIGEMRLYSGSASPHTDWLLCQGQALSRTDYSALFAVIGTTYGVGDGSTTFNIPDLRGAAPGGAGTSTGYTTNETLTLGTKHNDRLQGFRVPSGIAYPFGRYGTTTGAAANGPDGATSRTADPISGDPITDGVNGTPRTGATTRTKLLGVNFIIRAK